MYEISKYKESSGSVELVATEVYNDVLFVSEKDEKKEVTGISIAAIQKLLDQLVQKKYVERGEKDGSWRVFVTQ